MGQKHSRGKKERLLGSGRGRDDGCIGNRKVRTITLSALLTVFFVMALSWFFKYHDEFSDPNLAVLAICVAGDDSGCKNTANSWVLILIGAAVTIASAIFAILLFFINCDDKVGRIAGVGLIVGGLFYIVGWIWWIQNYTKLIHLENWPDDTRSDMNAQLACWIGEALLPSATAILLGVDVFMHLFDTESHRLASNLFILFVVSGMCSTTYYTNSSLSDDDDVTTGLYSSDSFAYIATGYAIVWLVSLLYVLLYIFTCCTCDCKDTACARLVHAVGLIMGGILTSIGYYMYSGDLENALVEGMNDEQITYFVGYTVFIGGCCFAWALDIGLDDVRSR